MRMTIPTQFVLGVLLEEPGEERYGYEIGEAAGLASGTVHPILARLEGAGWLESRWEDVTWAEVGRPARRYYRLTPDGVPAARDAMARAERRSRRPKWRGEGRRRSRHEHGGEGALPGGRSWTRAAVRAARTGRELDA